MRVQQQYSTLAWVMAFVMLAFILWPEQSKAVASNAAATGLQKVETLAATATTISGQPTQTTVAQASSEPTTSPPTTTAQPTPPVAAPAAAKPAQSSDVMIGGVQLIGCKPKPGVDVNAFWADYTKGGGEPYWPYVRQQVCA